MERVAVSKGLRFEILKRDKYRCTYCGATPVDRPLHVDHVKPVVDGGDTVPENLVTACGPCNLGKSKTPLEKRKVPNGIATEEDYDHGQQILEWLAIQRDVSEARNQVRDHLVEEWERRLGRIPAQLPGRLVKASTELGAAKLLEAFDAVAANPRIYSDVAKVKYLHGILRRMRGGGPDGRRPAPPPPPQKTERPRVTRAREAVYAAIGRINANPEEWRDKGMAGHIGEVFARAVGVDDEDMISAYYSDGVALSYSLEEGVDVHGVRLRTEPAPPNSTRWIVEEVPNYDAFREAYEELASELHDSIRFEFAWTEHQRAEGREHTPNFEKAAAVLLKRFDELDAWVEKYKVEDLGEPPPTRGKLKRPPEEE